MTLCRNPHSDTDIAVFRPHFFPVSQLFRFRSSDKKTWTSAIIIFLLKNIFYSPKISNITHLSENIQLSDTTPMSLRVVVSDIPEIFSPTFLAMSLTFLKSFLGKWPFRRQYITDNCVLKVIGDIYNIITDKSQMIIWYLISWLDAYGVERSISHRFNEQWTMNNE